MEKESLNYLKRLYKEYLSSRGIVIDNQDMIGNQYYLNYLKKMKNDLEIYKKCLLDADILDNVCLELDKGVLDSISSRDTSITLLTRYKGTFDELEDNTFDKRLIIKGTLLENPNGVRINLSNSEKFVNILRDNKLYCVTQNPFDYQKSFRDLNLLHNQGFNVVLGIYGKLSDKNYDAKLAKLNSFQKLVSGSLITRNIEDTYVSFVKTKGTSK